MLPGGGTVRSATDSYVHSYGLNNLGHVSFTATLQDGRSGVYVSSGGALRLLTRTGIAMPGIGIYSSNPGGVSGQVINDSGQVLFAATLSSGATVLVLATPIP